MDNLPTEDAFHQLFANNSSVMLLIDPADGAIVEANQAAQRFYGYPRAQLLAMQVSQINTRSLEEFRQALGTLAHGESGRFESRHRLADGAFREVEVSSTPLTFNGRALRHCIVHDITAQKLAEARLRENEFRWNIAVEGSGDGLWDLDVQTGVVYYSKRWKEMLGYGEAEIGSSRAEWQKRIHPEDKARVMAAVRAHEAGTVSRYAVEYRMRGKSGDWIWILARGVAVDRDAAGRPRRVIGTHTDITVRKDAEAALRAREEDYRQLFESMLDGFALHEIICDSVGWPVDYRFLSVNPAFERLTGLRAADLTGRTVRQVLPNVEAKWIERYGRVALTGEGVEFADYNVALQRHYEVSAFRPKPGQFATVFIDVTERVRAQESLREREERYQRITEAITDYIYTVRLQAGRVVETRHGPGCQAITGYRPEEFAADAGLWIEMVAPEDRSRVEDHARQTMAGNDTQPLEHRLRHKTGAMLWVSNTIVRHRDEQGRLVAYDGLIRDITAQKLAELSLRESNYFLRKAQEAARLGSYKFDVAGGRWTSSPQLDEIFGIDADYGRDVAGWINLVAPAQREEMIAYLRDQVVGARQRFDKEYAVIRPADRQRCWVHGAGELELDAAGRPKFLIGTIQDITQRRRSEQALRESESNLQEAQKLAGLGSWRVEFGPEGERWSASPELRRIYGNPGEVPLPDNFWFDAVHPDDAKAVAAAWAAFVRGTGSGEMEHRIIVNGQMKWVCVRAQVRLDPVTGRPVEITGSSQDITARKLAEADHARLVTAVEQATETIVITDTKGVILYANPAFERITGYTVAEAIGRNPRMLQSGRHNAAFYAQMWRTIAGGAVWSGRVINRRKDGSIYEEDATISPVRDSAGRVVNYVAVKRDVSREVQLENQVRQAQKMEAVGQLAGGVAHDFNNILAAVMMHIGLLQMEPTLDARTQASLGELSRYIQRGAGLTRQLLAFSRQQAMQPQTVDLHVVVTGLLDMLRRLLGEHIAIDLPGAAGDLNVHADPGMIEQVVINLCINARDAMPRGGRLTLSTEAVVLPPTVVPEPNGQRPGSFVRLSVADTGSGMSEETMQRIFEPFFTTKEKGRGTGLGLATVYGIVQQHHGWVTVESRLGAGTTFQVYLPVSEGPVEPDQGGDIVAPGRGRGETILLVEDEVSLRATVGAILRHHNYQVLEACDGPAALAIWQKESGQIDLVCTDIVMPGGLSGHDLIERFLADKPAVKIIATTGYSSHDPTAHSTLDNRIALLGKPFGPPQLLAAVRARLDQA